MPPACGLIRGHWCWEGRPDYVGGAIGRRTFSSFHLKRPDRGIDGKTQTSACGFEVICCEFGQRDSGARPEFAVESIS